jgi:MFS family permease
VRPYYTPGTTAIITRLTGCPTCLAAVFGIFSLTQMVCIPIATRASNSIGRFAVLQLGLTILGLGTASIGYAPTLWALAICRVAQGVGAVFVIVSDMAIALQVWCPNERWSWNRDDEPH